MIQLPKNLSNLRATWRAVNQVQVSPSFSIHNSSDSTSFYLYGLIGGLDGEAENFVKEVHAAEGKEINLYINSPGGFVWDAVSMYDALLNSSSKVIVEITGLAASAASFVAMAGDSVKIAEPGKMMIHDAQGIGIGSPADLREYADLLDSVSDDISGIYAKRAGGKPKAWREAMTATTFYNSSQAIDSKLADGLTDKKSKGPDNRTKLIQARHRVLVKGK